ncbi:MarR family winged helix-turn-helix transcriptional regulator [Nannocystaceae bacterium ST9]
MGKLLDNIDTEETHCGMARSPARPLAESELQRVRRHNVGRLATALASEFQAGVLERLRAGGHAQLRASHNAVLMNVDLAGTRQSEIAARAGVTRQAIGQLVDDLEQLGYVERTSDPADGRAQRVCFTTRGRALLDEGARVIGELELEWASRLAPGELERVRDVLVRLVAGLGLELPG